MGQRKQKRLIFFKEHPFCCFCGGGVTTEELDHQPARAFFIGREWPEGFVFPACTQCNRLSKDAENAISAIIFTATTKSDKARKRQQLDWFGANRPDIIAKLKMTNKEKREFSRASSIRPAQGMLWREFPVIKLESDIWRSYFEIIARKILLAFHYKACGSHYPKMAACGLMLIQM